MHVTLDVVLYETYILHYAANTIIKLAVGTYVNCIRLKCIKKRENASAEKKNLQRKVFLCKCGEMKLNAKKYYLICFKN